MWIPDLLWPRFKFRALTRPSGHLSKSKLPEFARTAFHWNIFSSNIEMQKPDCLNRDLDSGFLPGLAVIFQNRRKPDLLWPIYVKPFTLPIIHLSKPKRPALARTAFH
jgi:hypothetical protein